MIAACPTNSGVCAAGVASADSCTVSPAKPHQEVLRTSVRLPSVAVTSARCCCGRGNVIKASGH